MAEKTWSGFFRVHCEKYRTAKLHFWLFLDELRQNFFWSFAWVNPIKFGLALPVDSKNNSVTVVCSEPVTMQTASWNNDLQCQLQYPVWVSTLTLLSQEHYKKKTADRWKKGREFRMKRFSCLKIGWVLCDHFKKWSCNSRIFNNKIALLCNFCFLPTEWWCVEFQGWPWKAS